MSAMIDLVAGRKVENFEQGAIVVEQGTSSGNLYVLLQGEVEVLKDEVRVAKVSQPGAMFGEMSVLLGTTHTARVRTLKPSSFAIIDNPKEFLASSPEASMHVAVMLANRLNALAKYLVDVKRQYEGHDHIGMVDEVLETLMNRHPRQPQS